MISFRKFLVLTVILGSVFLLAGGLGAVQSYMYGASSYEEYRFSTVAPLFAGFILMGAFGLMYGYKNRGSWLCLVGFGITLFCYLCIESFYTMLSGV